jgi:hypothetical protein
VLAALTLVATAFATSAAADELLPVGWVDATANQELSLAVPIRIRPPGLDEASQHISRLFADELSRRGYAVAEGAKANVLSFRFITERAVETDRRYPHVRMRAPADRRAERAGDDVVPDIDDGRDQSTRLQSSPRTLVVEIVGAERQLIWTGRATASVKSDDLEEIAAITVPALLDRLGRDATGEDIYARK